MKEIRLHGKGGQGVVKASQMYVQAAVKCDIEGQFIPFFGVERKGSPVFGYLRLSEKEIRRKTQIYEPDVIVIFDDSLLEMKETFSGIKKNTVIVINTVKKYEELGVPYKSNKIICCNATEISEKLLGRNIPNTAMMGAMLHALPEINKEKLLDVIKERFNEDNKKAAIEAFESVKIIDGEKLSNEKS